MRLPLVVKCRLAMSGSVATRRALSMDSQTSCLLSPLRRGGGSWCVRPAGLLAVVASHHRVVRSRDRRFGDALDPIVYDSSDAPRRIPRPNRRIVA